jgi:hypothetical protein
MSVGKAPSDREKRDKDGALGQTSSPAIMGIAVGGTDRGAFSELSGTGK